LTIDIGGWNNQTLQQEINHSSNIHQKVICKTCLVQFAERNGVLLSSTSFSSSEASFCLFVWELNGSERQPF
jgi:hypothetical protein